MTFKTWIKQFKDYDTPFGDLAGDIKRDKAFPSTKKFERMAKHLICNRACSDALDTFAEAYMRYFREEYR